MILVNQLDSTQLTENVVTGTLTVGDKTYYTLEHDPIPKATYDLVPHTVQNGVLKGLQTYALVNDAVGVHLTGTEGRVAVLFHPGNFVSNSEGCVLVGLTKDTLEPTPSVGQSKLAFDAIIEALGGTNALGHKWVIQ